MKLHIFSVFALTAALFGQAAAQKKALDSSAYDIWKSVQGSKLSNDGN